MFRRLITLDSVYDWTKYKQNIFVNTGLFSLMGQNNNKKLHVCNENSHLFQ